MPDAMGISIQSYKEFGQWAQHGQETLTQFESKLWPWPWELVAKVLCVTHGNAMGNNHLKLKWIWSIIVGDMA